MTDAIPIATLAADYPQLATAQELAQMWQQYAGPNFQPDFPLFKIPSGGSTVWEDKDDPSFTPTRELRGIIVYERRVSQLYLTEYVDGDDAARRPDAWSIDGVTQTIATDTYQKIDEMNQASGLQPGQPGWLPYPSQSLSECPFNMFMTDPGAAILPGQKSGKANNEYIELYILLWGSEAPVPYIVRLSPMSFAAWEKPRKGYRQIWMTRGKPPHTIETILMLTAQGSGPNAYSTVDFQRGRDLDQQIKQITTEMTDSIKATVGQDQFALARGAAQPVLAAPATVGLPVGGYAASAGTYVQAGAPQVLEGQVIAPPAQVAPAAPASVPAPAPLAPIAPAPAAVAPPAADPAPIAPAASAPVAPAAVAPVSPASVAPAPVAAPAAPAPVAAPPAPAPVAAPVAPVAPAAPAPVAPVAVAVPAPAPVAVGAAVGGGAVAEIDF